MDVLMPQLGETVAEGKITQWFKAPGEPVAPGENLFEIETDKTSMEVPATAAGVLSEIRAGVGEVVPVGTIVAIIAEGLGAAAAKPAAPPAPARTDSATPRALKATAAIPAAKSSIAVQLDPFFEVRTPARNYGPARRGGVTVTPLARRLAAEGGVDLAA